MTELLSIIFVIQPYNSYICGIKTQLNIMKLRINPRWLSWAIIIAGAAVVFAFCMRAPWINDDMAYAYVMTNEYTPIIGNETGDETPERITDISDIVRSQTVHWQKVNGRAFAHTLVQWFCGIGGRTLFSVCDALIFIAFVLLVLWHGGSYTGRPRSVATVTALYFMLFLTYMTPAFQICYLWMFTVAMLWLRLLLDGRRRPLWMWPLLFILSMLAGCGNEALNIGLSIAIFLWWLQRIRRVNTYQYMLIVGFALGCAFLVFSPGNFGRVERYSGSTSVFWWLFILASFIYFTYLSVLPVIGITLWRKIRHKVPLKQIYLDSSLWFNIFIVCLLLGLALGSWANRLFFGAFLATLVLVQRLLTDKGFNRFWLTLTCAGALYVVACEWQHVTYSHNEYERITKEFIASKDGVVCTSIPSSLRAFKVGGTFSYDMSIADALVWQTSLRAEYPDHAPIKFIPSVAPGLNDTLKEPYTAKIAEDVWVCVRPKGSDCQFKSHHSIGIYNIRRPYKTLDVPFDDNIIEGKYWEAKIMESRYMMRILGLDSLSVNEPQ